MKNLFLFLIITLVGFTSCQSEANSSQKTEEIAVVEKKADKPEPFPITIGAFGATQDYPDAKMTSMDYQKGMFKFGIENYELTAQTPDAGQLMCANSGKGQHIHLIIDNGPYMAKYENKFDVEVADGEHTILAFLGRSYHESIKNGNAAVTKKVMVKDGSIVDAKDVKEPMLFYSRPKGTYVGKDTEKLLLDFYPVNVNLGADYKVKVEVNGQMIALLNKWQSYALGGLPMGQNKVTLTLTDGEGKTIDTPLNPVTREFTLKADPAIETK
jgi:hypothetical protein